MKTLKRTILLFTLTLLVNCSSNDDILIPEATLSGISPVSGPKETLVTISGSNFGTDANEVQVYFNEKEAAVQSVSEDQIMAVVPARAFTGIIKIIVNGRELAGPVFTYIITEIQVSTLAGSTRGFIDASGNDAQFSLPHAVAVDRQGHVYVADLANNKIRKISPEGIVSTLAGSTSGFSDGAGADAQFRSPVGVAVDTQGYVYVSDLFNQKIRKISPEGVVSTLAGSTGGFADGTGADAQFKYPIGITVDASGNVYVVDSGNHKIRKISPEGVVSTLAGSIAGFADGTGASAQFSSPAGIAIDLQGNAYVADFNNHRIRKVSPEGIVSTLAGSTQGYANGIGDNAMFNNPIGVAVDAQGYVYIGDYSNHMIRKISPEGIVSTLAGSISGFADGTGASAEFSFPYGMAADVLGNVYVADKDNHKVRKITQE